MGVVVKKLLQSVFVGGCVSFLFACGGGSSQPKGEDNPPNSGSPSAPAREDTQAPSVARQWNEVLLEAIRNDYARPTVHARNLFHISAAMFDAWAAFDSSTNASSPYLLGKTEQGFSCEFSSFSNSSDAFTNREQALSYAAFRLIKHRFVESPGAAYIFTEADALMAELGLDKNITSTDYANGSAAALGNHIAECYIQ